ncbi:DNA polymerase IV [Candidatus Woesearchaeota archaeon]|nr:DNA polymerase IV [Candidatus Woesearchaeota archaeon]
MKIILHVDMDSFFTSVEARNNPELRGKPVVVGAEPKQGLGRGVVSTASYEARKFGVKSAMPISIAYRLCPQATYLPVNMTLYIEASEQVMGRLRAYCERFEQASIDEAYLDISSSAKDYEHAHKIAEDIQKEINTEENLSCSIGIGPNKLIAKIASDTKKPGGITKVSPHEAKEFLQNLPAIKIPGIGPKTNERLQKLGIRTAGELAAQAREVLISEFGKYGAYIHDAAQGKDWEEVEESHEIKSINRNTTFEKDTADIAQLHKKIEEMAEDISESLESEGLTFKTAGVRVRYSNFETHTREKTLKAQSKGPEAITETAKSLLQQFLGQRKIRQIGVRVSSLKPRKAMQRTVSEFLA